MKPVSSNERRAEQGAYAVLAGLALEVALAFAFRTQKSPWEEWGPLVADVLIAAGVWVEIHFGRKASEESAERVSEANERSAAAELAAERLRAQYAWRRLSAHAIKLVSDSLRDAWESFDKQRARHLLVTYFGNDPETSNFAHELGSIFIQSGWTVLFISASYTGSIVYGLLVPDVTQSSDNAIVRFARTALSSAGIKFKEDKLPHPFMTNPESAVRVANWAVQMYVGPKPMPEFE